MRYKCVLLCVVCLGLGVSPATAATIYHLTAMNTGFPTQPLGLNDAGAIVGNYGLGDSNAKACSMAAGSGAPQQLSRLGGPYDNGYAYAINNNALIVGAMEIGAAASELTYLHAMQWAGGQPSRLTEPAAATNSYALDVNDSGAAVGQWDSFAAGTLRGDFVGVHAAKWLPDGRVVDLSVAGETYSVAASINSSGVAVGYRRTDRDRPIRWSADNTPQTLTCLSSNGGQARAINNLGQIAGYVYDASYNARPCTWDAAGNLTLLPVIGSQIIVPCDINDSGVIIGNFVSGGPVVWSDGQCNLLKNLMDEPPSVPGYGTVLFNQAYRINNQGVIAVMGSTAAPFAGGGSYLASPVPEPTTLSLLALGGMAILRRRHMA